MRTLLSIFAAALLLPASAQAQPSIEGYAISLDTGAPIEGAQVVLRDEQGLEVDGYDTVTTNAEGRYRIPGVPAGRYTLHAATGYTQEGDSLRYVLVSKAFTVEQNARHIHFGFWTLSAAVDREVSAVMQALEGDRDTLRGPIRYETFPEQLLARAALIESTIQTEQGKDLFNIDYQEPVRTAP